MRVHPTIMASRNLSSGYYFDQFTTIMLLYLKKKEGLDLTMRTKVSNYVRMHFTSHEFMERHTHTLYLDATDRMLPRVFLPQEEALRLGTITIMEEKGGHGIGRVLCQWEL